MCRQETAHSLCHSLVTGKGLHTKFHPIVYIAVVSVRALKTIILILEIAANSNQTTLQSSLHAKH